MTEINEESIQNNKVLEKEESVKRNNKKLKKSIVILACIIVGVIIIGFAWNHVKTSLFGDDQGFHADGPYIANIYVEGTIMSGQAGAFGATGGYQHKWTLDQIDELIADSENKGLIVFINSPGGGVYESDELYLKLKEYKEATDRPVYAVMGSLAASGGYYIATAADKIIANRNTWTGSIGVRIGTIYDVSEFLERYGVKSVTITSGKNKAMGSSLQPLTEEQKAIFQSLVDEAYEQFTGIVAEERNIKIDKVKQMADGRIYTAKQALSLGLVDSIGTLDTATKEMTKKYKLDECEIVDVVYEDDSLFGSLLSEAKMPNFGGGDASAILKLVEGESKFPVSYECELLDR